MMAAIVTGAMYGRAETRVSKNGKHFITARLTLWDGGKTAWINVIAFSAESILELERLSDGEYVTVQGRLKVDTFEKNGKTYPSINITAENVVALRQETKPTDHYDEAMS